MKRVALIAYLLALHVAVGWLAWKLDHRPSRLAFMREAHARMDATIPDGACIFLGDSITQGLAVSAVCDKAVNLGIGGQTTDQLAESMEGYRALPRASRIFVMIGVNDRTPGDFQRVASLLPPVPVVWSAPTRGSIEPARKACASLPRCRFVDTPALLAPLGDAAYTDGLHFSPAGYSAWIAALRKRPSPR